MYTDLKKWLRIQKNYYASLGTKEGDIKAKCFDDALRHCKGAEKDFKAEITENKETSDMDFKFKEGAMASYNNFMNRYLRHNDEKRDVEHFDTKQWLKESEEEEVEGEGYLPSYFDVFGDFSDMVERHGFSIVEMDTRDVDGKMYDYFGITYKNYDPTHEKEDLKELKTALQNEYGKDIVKLAKSHHEYAPETTFNCILFPQGYFDELESQYYMSFGECADRYNTASARTKKNLYEATKKAEEEKMESFKLQEGARSNLNRFLRESMFAEVRNDFHDDEKGATAIDAWETDDDNEAGKVVAWVYDDGNVEWVIPSAREDKMVIEAIEELKN